MAIQATNPTIVPPQDSVTYDMWWISSMTVSAPDASSVQVSVTLRKYRYADEYGTMEFSPVDPQVNFTVNNVLESSDQTIAQTVAALVDGIGTYGSNHDLI